LINGAPSLVDYYIDHVLGDQGGFEKDRDSLRKAVAFIKHIENIVDRNLFIKRVSEKLGLDQELLKKEISRARPAVKDDGMIREVYTAEIEKLELGLIQLLLIHPEKIIPVTQAGILDYFTNKDLKNLGETLQCAAAELQPWDAVERVSRLDSGPIREGLMKKLMEARPLGEERILDRLIVDTTRQIRRRWYKEKHRALKMDIAKAQEAGNADLCSRFLVEKERLLREEKMLGI
jgi:DNA primase